MLLAADQAYDFNEVRIDENYANSWLSRIPQLLETHVMSARAKLIPLIGKLVLTPLMVDGTKCLRVKGEASASGLLTAVAPTSKNNWNTGGRT